MLATTFHSPATNSAFTVSIPGSKFPAYRFASSQPLPRPVRPFAPPPVPGSPRSPATSTLTARCRFHDQPGLPRPGFHSPSGLLHPSGSKRSAGLAASWPVFRNRPIPVHSPQPTSITSFRLWINVPESLPLRRLAVLQLRAPNRSSGFCSPSGFSSPPDQSIPPGLLLRSSPSSAARLSLAPRNRPNKSFGCGSPFRTRYRPGGPLRHPTRFRPPTGTTDLTTRPRWPSLWIRPLTALCSALAGFAS
jgi:hypothetical protein